MDDLPEAVGTAMTGGLLARAVEPGTGHGAQPGEDGHTHEAACLNCGTPLAGSHCYNCGQRAHVHRTLSAFFHDLLHGVLHFEGKTWRTIPLLAWKPGQLTREYIEGKRARYVSPIAMFLFVVFLTFALFNIMGGAAKVGAVDPDMDREMRTAISASEEELAALRERRARNLDEPENLARIDAEIADLEAEQKVLVQLRDKGGSDFIRGMQDGFEDNAAEPREGAANNKIASAIDKVKDNPQLAIYKMQTNAYKFSWMLIPLSVPFVWLLFAFNRKFRGYDHTVFTTYSITFMIALVGLASVFGYFGMGPIAGAVLLYAPWHMYKQLRGTYGVSRFGAFWRMLALSAFAWLALGLFVAILTTMAA